MYENRVFPTIRPDFVKEVLPEYFETEYPNLILFLENYYDALDSSGEFGEVLKDLYDIRDIGTTQLKYLDNLFDEIGLGLAPTFVSNPREILRNLAKFFRVKGSVYSAEGFFRSFYNTTVDLEYPKDKIFLMGDSGSIIGPKSDKKIQDGKLHQVLSTLVKTTVPLKDWEDLYKKFVHPAGFYLASEMRAFTTHTNDISGINANTTALNLRVEADSDRANLKMPMRIIGKVDMGRTDIIAMDGPTTYYKCDGGTFTFSKENALFYTDSNVWYLADSFGLPYEDGMGVQTSYDAGIYGQNVISLAAIDLGKTIGTENAIYTDTLSTVAGGEVTSIYETMPAKLSVTSPMTIANKTRQNLTIDIAAALSMTAEELTRGGTKTYISRMYVKGNMSDSSTGFCVGFPQYSEHSLDSNGFNIGRTFRPGMTIKDSDAVNYTTYQVSKTAPVIRIDNILDSNGILQVQLEGDSNTMNTVLLKFNLSNKPNSIYEWIKYDSLAVFDINSFNYPDNQTLKGMTLQDIKNKPISYLKNSLV